MTGSCRQFVSVLVAALAVVALATVAVALDSPAVTVSIGAGDIAIYPNAVPHFAAMNVVIADPAGRVVVSTQSLGEAVSWVAGSGAPDGQYRYEAVVYTNDPTAVAQTDREQNNPPGLKTHRAAGMFMVSGGQIVPPGARGDKRP